MSLVEINKNQCTYATLCIGACTALASCTHSRPHSFLQRKIARPARECWMWEFCWLHNYSIILMACIYNQWSDIDKPLIWKLCCHWLQGMLQEHIDGLLQKRHNSSGLALELCLFLHQAIDIALQYRHQGIMSYSIDMCVSQPYMVDGGCEPSDISLNC